MSESDPTFSRRLRWLIALAVVVYAGLLTWRMGAVAGATDSSGYLNQARLLASGRIRTETRALATVPARSISAFAYVPAGFSPASAGDPREMVAIYPVGLPLLVAAAASVIGWEAAAPVTMMVHALAGIALTFALGRAAGLRRRVALAGAALLAACPLYVFVSLQLLSDMPALVWTTAALWCAWRTRETERGPRWAWATGAVFGVAVLIRPTNVLAAVPLAVLLRPDVRVGWRVAAAGAPLAVGWALFNSAAYGSPWRLGYGDMGVAFGGENVLRTAWHYVEWLPVLTAGVAVLAPAVTRARGVSREWRWGLVAWVGAFAGFYAWYEFTHDSWWMLRFLLPALPAMLVAGLLVVQQSRWGALILSKRAGGTIMGVAVAWLLVWSGPLRSWKTGNDERAYVAAAAWMQETLPADALIFGGQVTGAFYYYTRFTVVHWAFATDDDVGRLLDCAAREGRPVFAVMFPFEQELLGRPVPGCRWRRFKELKRMAVWRLVADEVERPETDLPQAGR